MVMQNGGWYDNPATGKNQRYWSNGTWTDGAEPGKSGGSNPVGDWSQKRLDEINAAADKYANDLRATAKGDYDFAIKWLTKQHETALGSNDTETAKFFEQVASSLETKIGRIPYDYLTKTDREKQDIANYMLDQNRAAEDQFQRDYQFKQQQDFAKKQEADLTKETFNARGLADSGLQIKKQQDQATQRQLFETNPQARASALETDTRNAAIRNRQLLSERTLQDITTGSRRTGQDAQMGFDQGKDQADRSLASRLAEITAQQELMKRQAVSQVNNELGYVYGA